MNSKSILARLGLIACAMFLFSGLTIAQTSTKTDAKPAASAAKAKMVDINSASKDDLKALPGIGDAYSQKIIDGRPYTMKTELVSKNVLPKTTYDKISKMVIAKKAEGAAAAAPAAAPVGW